jgi:hypothetical protein
LVKGKLNKPLGGILCKEAANQKISIMRLKTKLKKHLHISFNRPIFAVLKIS